ncbi:hypothetical protein Tco_1093785 [Tanacetum coccineum]|uniref:Reverse transcriptase domain-containing protein n=1 Tax=Tanacetum coccineum TaxID=301880 RepID=A0ABQ5IDQ3_9ASTR
MDRYPNSCLEELEAFMTLWDVKPRVEECSLEALSVDELIAQLQIEQMCESKVWYDNHTDMPSCLLPLWKAGHKAKDCRTPPHPANQRRPGSQGGQGSERSGVKNESRLEVISSIRTQKYIDQGRQVFLIQIMKEEETKIPERRIEDVPVVRDFPEVFPKDLLGLPPTRQVEFHIELIPGAAPVARAPYRLAPAEMKELAEKLKELSDKGFIRSSSSPWGAPMLFVKKKDGSF